MFLYEGRKVLFRFSLAVLKLYERRILSMIDPVTIFQFIKEVVKHIFNVEELFRVREGGRGREGEGGRGRGREGEGGGRRGREGEGEGEREECNV